MNWTWTDGVAHMHHPITCILEEAASKGAQGTKKKIICHGYLVTSWNVRKGYSYSYAVTVSGRDDENN